MSDPHARFDGPPAREKMFNAPLAVVAITLALPVLFFFQERLPDLGAGMAFVPVDLEQGRWSGLFTYMLVHGGWGHVLMNAVGVLAFGTPVARQFGPRYGSSVFLLFFVFCGAAAALGYGLIHWGSTAGVAGASGAVFGLAAAWLWCAAANPPQGRWRRRLAGLVGLAGLNLATWVMLAGQMT